MILEVIGVSVSGDHCVAGISSGKEVPSASKVAGNLILELLPPSLWIES